MTEIFTHVLMYALGICMGYILWAPPSPFKTGFLDGLSLKFFFKRFRK